MDLHEEQQETAVTLAASVAWIAWCGSGLILYLTTESASLWSWSALLFFVVGTFPATIVFGVAIYAVQRGFSKALHKIVKAPNPGVATAIRSIRWVLFVVEAVVIYLVASWVFHEILEPARAELPAEFSDDRENFVAAMTAFSDANRLDREVMAGRETAVAVSPKVEEELQARIKKGLEHGRKVSDQFLTYLHPDFPAAYKSQLIRGHELLLAGRVQDEVTAQDVITQVAGIELLRRFYEGFWPSHQDEIARKLE